MKCSGVFAISTAFATAMSFGGDFTWVGDDSSSWKSPDSYAEKAVPAENDTVTFPQDAKATITDAEFDFVSSLGEIILQRKCTVTFDVTGEKSFACPIHQPASTKEEATNYHLANVIVKCGSGSLTLAAHGKNPVNDSCTDYMASVDVCEGALKYYQGSEGIEFNTFNVVDISVAEAGQLFLPRYASVTVLGDSVTGLGLITNDNPTVSTAEADLTTLTFQNATSVFEGSFGGPINVRYTYKEDGFFCAAGTNSTFTGLPIVYGGGTLGVAKFGKVGEASSIGPRDFIYMRQNGCRLLYIGTEDEQTDKGIYLSQNPLPNVIDAGERGGVEFTGAWCYWSTYRCFGYTDLAGSNTEHECVFSGPFTEPSKSGVFNWSTFLTKKGPGIWRFADNANRRNRGVVAVEDGILRFDSIAEAGEVCSLGLSSILTERVYESDVTKAPLVPYAFLLGGGESPVFEYTGTADATCSTRPIAVQGDATLRNATDRNFAFANVFGLGDGAKTLTLAGDSATAENRLSTVTNACGTLSIAKEGAGTWTLKGDVDVNGSVSVKGGTLVIERAKSPQRATWFRLNVKENYVNKLKAEGHSIANSQRVYVQQQELGFYDADGNRQGTNLSFVAPEGGVEALQAGEVAYLAGTWSGKETRTPALLFDEKVTTTSAVAGWHCTAPGQMTPTDPNTWARLVMRLPDDITEVVAYDYSNFSGIESDDPARGYQMRQFSIDASLDGKTWVEVTNVTDATESETANVWHSDGSAIQAGEAGVRKGAGYPINTKIGETTHVFEDGIVSVSVAEGATLRADGEGGELVVKGLTIDPDAGAGTVDGFAFAENGVLNLTKLPSGGGAYKFTLRNCKGFGNVADWSARLNGQPTDKFTFAANDDGTVTVFRKGLMLLFR